MGEQEEIALFKFIRATIDPSGITYGERHTSRDPYAIKYLVEIGIIDDDAYIKFLTMLESDDPSMVDLAFSTARGLWVNYMKSRNNEKHLAENK